MSEPVRGGRFGSGFAPVAARFNASHGFDRRLARFDVAQSMAHVQMLAAQNLVTADECQRLVLGLGQVQQEIDTGKFPWRDALEDVHMHVEARLGELVGDVAGKLQTGRSRNDQVATDLRLYAKDAALRLRESVQALRRVLLTSARNTIDVIAPGYTHLQRAQPIRLAHQLLAHVECLGRDAERLQRAHDAANISPLGSGALAGTSLPIDREQTAKALGFSAVTRNSIEAVADRDFVCELVFACVLTQVHLSRLAEEIVLWASNEFGFVKLPESHCSGSSLMPQKINPDVAELARAKVGRVTGDLVSLLVVLKALPYAYNKDLQETQEPLYDAVETLMATLSALHGLCQGLEFDVRRIADAASDPALCATDLAEQRVREGGAFREAHSEVGKLVREGAWSKMPSAETAVEARKSVGGPSRARVLAEIERLEAEVKHA